MKLKIEPVTPERWGALEELFGHKGACAGCWCMLDRIARSEYMRQKGDGNKVGMKKLISSGKVPGLLVYQRERPVGWCSLGPREEFPALERSKVRKAVDKQPVWSLVCFFIDKSFRGRGISTELIRGAVQYAREQGAEILEAYPIEPKHERMPDVFAHPGIASAFTQTGFIEVARRSPTRPVMRYEL